MRARLCFSWVRVLLFSFICSASSPLLLPRMLQLRGGATVARVAQRPSCSRRCSAPCRRASRGTPTAVSLHRPLSHPLSPPLILICPLVFSRHYRPVYRAWARIRPGLDTAWGTLAEKRKRCVFVCLFCWRTLLLVSSPSFTLLLRSSHACYRSRET